MKTAKYNNCSSITVTCVIVVLVFCGSISGPTMLRKTDVKKYFNPTVEKLRNEIIENEVLNILATEEISEFLKKLPVSALNKINSVIGKDAQLGREYLHRLMAYGKMEREDPVTSDLFKSTFADSFMKALRRNKRKEKQFLWDSQKSRSFFLTTPAPTAATSSTVPSILLENFEIFQIPSDIFLQNFKTSQTVLTTTTETPTLQKYLNFDHFLSSTRAKPIFWSTTTPAINLSPTPRNRFSAKQLRPGSKPTQKFSGILSTASKVDKSFNPSHGANFQPELLQINNNSPNSWPKPDVVQNPNQNQQGIQPVQVTKDWEIGELPRLTPNNNNNRPNQEGVQPQIPAQNTQQIHHEGQNFNQHVNPTSLIGGFLNQNNQESNPGATPSQIPNNNNNGILVNQVTPRIQPQNNFDFTNNNYQSFNPQENNHNQNTQQHYPYSQSQPQQMPPNQQNVQWNQYYPTQNQNPINNINNNQNHQFGVLSITQAPPYQTISDPSPPSSFYGSPPFQPPQFPNAHPQFGYGWPPHEQQYSPHQNPFNNPYNNNPYSHNPQPYEFHQYNPGQYQNNYQWTPSKYEGDEENSDEDKKGKKKGVLHSLHKAIFGDKHKDKKNKHKDKEKELNYGWPGWSSSGGYTEDTNNYKGKGKGKGSNENQSDEPATSFSDTYDHYSKKASGFWDKMKQKVEDHFEKKAHDEKHGMKKKKSFYTVTQKIYGISISILSFLAFGAYILMLLFQSAVNYLTFPLLSGIIGLLSGDGGMQLVQFFVGRSLNDYHYNDWWQSSHGHRHSSFNDTSNSSLINELESRVKGAFSSVKKVIELLGK